jgi:glycosyltransferase involved in cell wall biosynthesis
MNEASSYCAIIPALSEDIVRPTWSVMIPTYNCADYLRETLASVLIQDPGPEQMQITVVDNCSTQDDPETVVKELGKGRVEFHRQDKNVGPTKNFQTCLERARGKLIHLLHSDDCVREDFYQKMEQGFEKAPEIGAAFCRHIIMDENSLWEDLSVLEQSESGVLPPSWLDLQIGFPRIQTPAIVVRREVYEKLGGFDCRLQYTDDWEMEIRIAENFPIWYEVEPLALWRKHSKSSTAANMVDAENIRDARKAITIIQERDISKRMTTNLLRHTKQNWAFFALVTADSMINSGDAYGAINQIREAMRCSQSYRVIRSAGRILLVDGTKLLWRSIF